MLEGYQYEKQVYTPPSHTRNRISIGDWLFMTLIAVVPALGVGIAVGFIFHLRILFYGLIVGGVFGLNELTLYFTTFKPDRFGYSKWDRIKFYNMEDRDVKVTDIKKDFKIKGEEVIVKDTRNDIEKVSSDLLLKTIEEEEDE